MTKCMTTHGGKIEAIEKRLTNPKAMERGDDGKMSGSCPTAILNRVEGEGGGEDEGGSEGESEVGVRVRVRVRFRVEGEGEG